MNGHKRGYDFLEFVNIANTLNHIVVVEYRKNRIEFKKLHNKMENMWATLHKVQPRE